MLPQVVIVGERHEISIGQDVSTGFQVLTAVTVKITVFWVVTTCGLDKNKIIWRKMSLSSSWPMSQPNKESADVSSKLSVTVTTQKSVLWM
jgi:hypothetical protein